MGMYAEMEIERFISSFNGCKNGKRQKQNPPHEIPDGLTWKQRRNLKTRLRKKRQREEIARQKVATQ